jgi:hypothetical protein
VSERITVSVKWIIPLALLTGIRAPDLGHGGLVVFLSLSLKTLLVRLEGLYSFPHRGSLYCQSLFRCKFCAFAHGLGAICQPGFSPRPEESSDQNSVSTLSPFWLTKYQGIWQM